jgi:2-dehydro-3-deoxyphosphogluconate aldolase / (4S)-4-hydroxy-2-oxoglutarate aldolase
MDRNQSIISKIKAQGLLPLFYNDDASVCVSIVEALYAGGSRIIEFTNRGSAALDNFKKLIAARNEQMKDLLLGIGTIRNGNDAKQFIDAGADFLVSPVYDADVADTAYINKILWIPGCMTPTEIHGAEKAGCQLIKLFPGNALQPAFVSAVKELFPLVDMMPTGGVEVNKENLTQWFDAGVCAVGMGSKLVSRDIVAAKNYEKITTLTKDALKIIAGIKQKS